MKKQTKLYAALAAAAAFTATAASAATVSVSTTAPTVGALDIANLVATTGTQKWFNDIEHDAGQTFTPTADGQVQSITIQIGSTQQNLLDAAGENVDLRFGTISRPGGVFTFTDVYVENAVQTTDWLSSEYITFTFDTPQAVTAGVEYGLITDAQAMGAWQQGIPYRQTTGNTYAGGSMINRGGEITNNDVKFHIGITPIPEPSAVALFGLAGIALILRRRK